MTSNYLIIGDLMALRPGRCYSKRDKKPYTRVSQRKPRRSYIKGVPGSKIRQFETGDWSVEGPEFYLIAEEPCQIRHNALEAARVNANRVLVKKIGEKKYFLKVLPYPHHVLRENPIAAGAGADRLQEGMRRSFGKPIAVSAKVKKGQKIMLIRVPEGSEDIAKEALRVASHKLPTPCSIIGG